MNRSNTSRGAKRAAALALAAACSFAGAQPLSAAQATPPWHTGNYFTSFQSVLQEFKPDGQLVQSMTLPSGKVIDDSGLAGW